MYVVCCNKKLGYDINNYTNYFNITYIRYLVMIMIMSVCVCVCLCDSGWFKQKITTLGDT